MKGSIYEELERDSINPLNIRKKNLGDSNAKMGLEDNFKAAIGMRVYVKLVMIMELEK
jgi:hypothetical protein